MADVKTSKDLVKYIVEMYKNTALDEETFPLMEQVAGSVFMGVPVEQLRDANGHFVKDRGRYNTPEGKMIAEVGDDQVMRLKPAPPDLCDAQPFIELDIEEMI